MRKTYRPPAGTRALWLLAALLQLVLPGAAAWADAVLETHASRAVVHVEAESTRDCAPAHAADCGLCRHLATAGRASDASADPGTPARRHEPPRVVAIWRPVVAHHALPNSRAPPRAS